MLTSGQVDLSVFCIPLLLNEGTARMDRDADVWQGTFLKRLEHSLEA